MKSLSKKPWSALLAGVALSAACAPRVVVPNALSRYAPIEQRRQQYNRYRAVQREITINRVDGHCGAYGCAPPIVTVYSQARLANGAVVLDPAELLPLVARDSRTARHIASARTFETAGIISLVSTMPLTVVGTGFLFGGGALGWNVDTSLHVSVPLLVFGGLAAITGGILRAIAADERVDAFGTYDDDFRDNLGLCVGPVERGECTPRTNRLNDALSGQPLSNPFAGGLPSR